MNHGDVVGWTLWVVTNQYYNLCYNFIVSFFCYFFCLVCFFLLMKRNFFFLLYNTMENIKNMNESNPCTWNKNTLFFTSVFCLFYSRFRILISTLFYPSRVTRNYSFFLYLSQISIRNYTERKKIKRNTTLWLVKSKMVIFNEIILHLTFKSSVKWLIFIVLYSFIYLVNRIKHHIWLKHDNQLTRKRRMRVMPLEHLCKL